MYNYRFVLGEYDDKIVLFYQHEKKMSKKALQKHLSKTWNKKTKITVESNDWDSVGWQPVLERLFTDAGFVVVKFNVVMGFTDPYGSDVIQTIESDLNSEA